MPLTQPIKYHGGKFYLAEWILSHIPKHTHYVEPYFGGGAVLLRKNPHGVSEVVNDINGELMNFWSVLQRPDYLLRFTTRLSLTPFSEQVFLESRTPSDDPVESAVRFFVRMRMSRQGLGKDFATLSRNRTRSGMNEQVSSWLGAVEGLPEIHRRLQRVVILSREAIDVITSQDGPNTFFYLDPPYLHSERVTTKDYKYEMTASDHERLLRTLSRIKGRFALSGYPSTLYDKYAAANSWFVDTKDIDNKASSASVKEIKTECLWMNYDWRKK